MAIRLYNTLTQQVEDLVTLEPGKARVYVCGITTYDLAHAGHGRTYTTFDVLVRHLRARGLVVTHCRNVTDVDDKIVTRAKELGEEPLALSKRMSDLADRDLAAIGCAKPDVEPRVSTSIDEIISLIGQLIEKGLAYAAKTEAGTDVYFAVRAFPDYGKLSRRKIDDLLSGARVDVGDVKRDPLDFALWKGCKDEGFGWESPWGKGRPGWHIECSAMANAHLGPNIDIHGGGMDLIFPHHENEVAQSEGAHGGSFSRFWLHGGFLNVDKEKMSKSLGNFVTIRDVLDRNDAEAFRYFALGTHYRGPISFDVEKLEDGRVRFPGVDDAERRMEYLYSTRDALVAASIGEEARVANVLQGQSKIVQEAREKVLLALDNDLNTPIALSVLAELAKACNEIVAQIGKLKNDLAARQGAKQLAAVAARELAGAVAPLGLMQASSEDFWKRTTERRMRIRKLDPKHIDAKVKERTTARANKDFAAADAARKELSNMGVELLDAGDQTSWRVTL